jgi:putative endonuclease
MKTYYTYIVRCDDNSLYTGYTDDVNRRLVTHNEGKGAKYTRGRLPVVLVYYEGFPDKSTAMKREIEIKKLSKGKKEKLINSK